MKPVAELRRKYFKDERHPYNIYEQAISGVIQNGWVILDAGCGRTAPVLRKFAGQTNTLIGIDCEEFTEAIPGVNLLRGDISKMGCIAANSIDLVISRAVLEHIRNPECALKEINRVLRPNGTFIFLVPNLYDYNSILSLLLPNRIHSFVVSKVEGRKVKDVFPAYYRINTKKKIKHLTEKTGFRLKKFSYLGQYPSNFSFNRYLFFLATCYEKILEKVETAAFLRGWILAELVKLPSINYQKESLGEEVYQ